VAHAKIATIATDDHHPLQEFRNSVGAQWPFLSDPGRTVQKDLEHPGVHGPRQRPDDPAHSRAEPRLIVHSIYNGYWFWGRPSLVDLWHDLRDVTREIRPDWDLGTPGYAKLGRRVTCRPSTAGQVGHQVGDTRTR
jgi:hypothetical protein